jgi:hypothetical protein
MVRYDVAVRRVQEKGKAYFFQRYIRPNVMGQAGTNNNDKVLQHFKWTIRTPRRRSADLDKRRGHAPDVPKEL